MLERVRSWGHQDKTVGGKSPRLTRRTLLHRSMLIGGAAAAVGLAPWERRVAAAQGTSGDGCAAAGSVPDAITAIMQKPRYTGATWNLLVVDVATGETLYD